MVRSIKYLTIVVSVILIGILSVLYAFRPLVADLIADYRYSLPGEFKNRLAFFGDFADHLKQLRLQSNGKWELPAKLEIVDRKRGGADSAFISMWLTEVSAIQAKDQGTIPANSMIHPLLRWYNQSRLSDQSVQGVRFLEIAEQAGVQQIDTGKGVAAEDFNGDGKIDLMVGASFGSLHYFQNVGDSKFEDVTERAGLTGVLQPYQLSAADFDNDGLIDLFVSRPFHHFQLFKNTGAGVFQDVTFSSGLMKKSDSETKFFGTWHAAWGDVDRDGDLDLFVSQWGQHTPLRGGLYDREPMRSALYINRNGHFLDETEERGLAELTHEANLVGAAFGDLDQDGFPELFLSSFVKGRSVLLKNESGSFEPLSEPLRTVGGFTSAFLDINQDGKLDLFHSGHGEFRSIAENLYRVQPTDAFSNVFYLMHNKQLQARSDMFQSELSLPGLGTTYGDVNNDGCFDFYLGSGNPEPWYVAPNMLFVGNATTARCDGSLSDQTSVLSRDDFGVGQAAVMFDLDDDGDTDLYAVQGGMWPGSRMANKLYLNRSEGLQPSVRVRLRGRVSNRFGVGAIVSAQGVTGSGQVLKRYRLMNNKTGFGSAPYIVHVAFGQPVGGAELRVWWPVSGQVRRYTTTLENQLVVLDERDGEVEDFL